MTTATIDSVGIAPATPAHVAWLTGNGNLRPGDYAIPPWIAYVNDVLVDSFLDSQERFTAIEGPVRHGKSDIVSVAFPTWAIGLYPTTQVTHTSYSIDLSKGFSMRARDIIAAYGPQLFGVQLAPGWQSAYWWKVCYVDDPHKRPLGGMRIATPGRTITGTGADVIIIDDPIKNALTADSKLERDRQWDFYQRTLRNRLQPGGKVYLAMARWHVDDLTGRLFDESYNLPGGDLWERVHLPAIAEPAPWELDDTGALADGTSLEDWTDVLGRHYGEPLWPEMWSLERLRRLQVATGPRGWLANFQQRPTSATGGLFPRHKWKFVDALPASGLLFLRYWDLAASATGDWCAGVLLAMDARGQVYVVDVARTRGEPEDVEEFVGRVADNDKARFGSGAVHHIVEQEPGSGGKFQAKSYVVGPLGGHSAEWKTVTGNKVNGAQPFAGQVGAGNVFVVLARRSDGELGRPHWYHDFAEEAGDFPHAPNDDQIDSASKGYMFLRERWDKKRKSKSRIASAASRTVHADPGLRV